jgi:hypothetical protein
MYMVQNVQVNVVFVTYVEVASLVKLKHKTIEQGRFGKNTLLEECINVSFN